MDFYMPDFLRWNSCKSQHVEQTGERLNLFFIVLLILRYPLQLPIHTKNTMMMATSSVLSHVLDETPIVGVL